MLCYTHFVWGLKFHDFLGDDGFNSATLLKEIQIGTVPSAFLSFWWIVPEQYAWTVHLFCLGVLALFTCGAMTRVTSILALLITISYAHRAMLANYGLDQINTVLIFYLTLSRCGDAYSVDRLWFRFRKARRQLALGTVSQISPPSPHWTNNLATRLLQFHYCVIYFMAGISKLQGESWWAGEAVWRTAANYEYQSADLTWLAHVPWLVNLVTHGTILWEISFCFLVWNPLLRPLILLCGVAMHLGIGGFLGMWTFGSAMIFGYLAFVSPAVIQRCLNPVVSLFASGTRTLKIHKGHRTALRRAARLLTFDFCRRVTIQLAADSTDPPDSRELNDFHADSLSNLPRPDIAPLIVICSRESIAAHSRLIDYLAGHGFNCALTRSVANARELTAFHDSQACLLWLEHSDLNLRELSGNFAAEWQHEFVPMIIKVPLPEIEIPEASRGFPANIRLLSNESTYRRLRSLIGELIGDDRLRKPRSPVEQVTIFSRASQEMEARESEPLQGRIPPPRG